MSHVPIPLAGMLIPSTSYGAGSVYSICRLAWWVQDYFEQCVHTVMSELATSH